MLLIAAIEGTIGNVAVPRQEGSSGCQRGAETWGATRNGVYRPGNNYKLIRLIVV